MDATKRTIASDAPSDAPWTTRRLLRWMMDHFSEKGIDAPRVCAEMLLASAIGCERLRLYMEPDRPADESERARLRDFVRRVSAHEPVQFVVGEAWFFSRPFHVTPATLIPRPSSERLVEEALAQLRERRALNDSSWRPRVLDLCTGSGCIAISLALAKGVSPEVVATDVSDAALELARRNAERHGASSIEFRIGDLWSALTKGRYELISANPPYVSDAEWLELAPNVKDYEPALALRGGVDGLDVVRRVVHGAPERLNGGGVLLVEIGHAQRDAALALASATDGLESAEVLSDHEGFWRVLRARRR